MTEENLS